MPRIRPTTGRPPFVYVHGCGSIAFWHSGILRGGSPVQGQTLLAADEAGKPLTGRLKCGGCGRYIDTISLANIGESST